MGSYTEFHFNAKLKQDTPKEVIDILFLMVSDNDNKENTNIEIPSHPLFNSERWTWMLTCSSSYFPFYANSTLIFDDIWRQYVLSIRCSIKNYNSEIENFVDWINPHIDAEPNTFLGFRRWEEADTPTHIRKRK